MALSCPKYIQGGAAECQCFAAGASAVRMQQPPRTWRIAVDQQVALSLDVLLTCTPRAGTPAAILPMAMAHWTAARPCKRVHLLDSVCGALSSGKHFSVCSGCCQSCRPGRTMQLRGCGCSALRLGVPLTRCCRHAAQHAARNLQRHLSTMRCVQHEQSRLRCCSRCFDDGDAAPAYCCAVPQAPPGAAATCHSCTYKETSLCGQGCALNTRDQALTLCGLSCCSMGCRSTSDTQSHRCMVVQRCATARNRNVYIVANRK